MTDEEVRRLRTEMSRRHREVWAASITPGIDRSNKLIDAKKQEPPEHPREVSGSGVSAMWDLGELNKAADIVVNSTAPVSWPSSFEVYDVPVVTVPLESAGWSFWTQRFPVT